VCAPPPYLSMKPNREPSTHSRVAIWVSNLSNLKKRSKTTRFLKVRERERERFEYKTQNYSIDQYVIK
jgi:hypothetical protein